MDVRIIGIDLTDTDTTIAMSDSDKCFHFPAAICRDKSHDVWYIGEEAYEKALSGKGILTDRLLAMTERKGTATVRGIRYTGPELLARFLSVAAEKSAAEAAREAAGKAVGEAAGRAAGEADSGFPDFSEKPGGDGTDPRFYVIVLPEYKKQQAEELKKHLVPLGFPSDRTIFISRSESFLYYVMNQPRQYRQSDVSLFDLADQSLIYYSIQGFKEKKRLYIRSDGEKQEQAFNLSVLESPSGEKLADNIMAGCAERLLKKRTISTVFLTGKGFTRYDWAGSFMKLCCTRRKVFLDLDLFARGAVCRGSSYLSGERETGFTALCSGRSRARVTIPVMRDGVFRDFPLLTAGEPLMNAGKTIRLLLEDREPVKLTLTAPGRNKEKTIAVPLTFLPERPPKASFLLLQASFPDEETLELCLADGGFGELFQASDARHTEEVKLVWD